MAFRKIIVVLSGRGSTGLVKLSGSFDGLNKVKCECRTVMVAYDVEAQQSFALPGEWREALARFEKCTVEELEAGR